MSIQSSVKRNSAPIGMAAIHASSHLVIIRDPELGVKLENDEDRNRFIETSGRGARKRWAFPLSRTHIFRDELENYEWPDDEKPEWVDTAISESLWASENTPLPSEGIAWIAGSHLIIRSRYMYTLWMYVQTLPSSSITYNHKMKSWIIAEMDFSRTDGLRDKLEYYSINISPELEENLDRSKKWKSILQDLVQKSKDDGYTIPSIFPTKRKLKPHQEDAVLVQSYRRLTLLADQVGLGKGGEFISGALSIVQRQIEESEEDDVWPILVVTKSSLKEDIAVEIEKWKNDAKIEVLYGYEQQPISPEAQFVVTNVDLLNKRKQDIIDAKIKALIADEAHMLKNQGALRTEAMQEIADEMRTRIESPFITLASGTPFLNRPEELWSLLCIFNVQTVFSDYAAKKLGTRTFKISTKNGWKEREVNDKNLFERYFCDGGYDENKRWDCSGASNTTELNQLLLETIMIRRKKSDVINPLPELDERILPIEMSDEYGPEYDKAYDEFREYMKQEAELVAREEGTSVQEAIQIVTKKIAAAGGVMKQTRLRQIAAKGKIEGVKKWIHSFMDGSFEYKKTPTGDTIRIGDDPDRRKLIVFVYHKEIQEMLIEDPELVQYGLVRMIAGEDPEEHKRLFQEDENCRLIICYSGAREGHTLTAAKDVLIVEVPYDPSWVVQMAGRCWARFSEQYEPHEATAWMAVTPGTIDSNILSKTRRKKSIFSSVVDGEGLETLPEDDGNDKAADALLSLIMSGNKRLAIAS